MATETRATPKASVFSLKAPYLSTGRVNVGLAKTDGLWLSLKVNAEGGENALHGHTEEDHAFIVLQGEVTFFDKDGNETVVGPYQGIMLPRGTFYRYLNTGEANLFLLRVDAGKAAEQRPEARLRPDGKPLPSSFAENKHIDGVPIPGRFFGV